jgi:hypothetical protein
LENQLKEVSNLIITLTNTEFNNAGNEIYTIKPEELQLLRSMGVISKKNKIYTISFNYRDFQLHCPLLEFGPGKTVVIWPSFKLPRRPYPCFIYLYAVTRYLTTKMSMRLVAEEVRKKFGLQTFSHSTISRALKKLIQQVSNHQERIMNMTLQNTEIEPARRKNRDDSFHRKAATLLKALFPVLTHTISYGCSLAYLFYNLTAQFIL